MNISVSDVLKMLADFGLIKQLESEALAQVTTRFTSAEPQVVARMVSDGWEVTGRPSRGQTEVEAIETATYFLIEFAAKQLGIENGANDIAEEGWLKVGPAVTAIVTPQIGHIESSDLTSLVSVTAAALVRVIPSV